MHDSDFADPRPRRFGRLETGCIRTCPAVLATTIMGLVCACAVTAETTAAESIATVEADVVGRTITWRVTNLADVPIVRVSIATFKTYDHLVPDDWDFEESKYSMHTWVTDGRAQIRRGFSREFRLTGGASGCKPGLTTAELTFADGGVVRVENVITFQEESLTTTALPPVIVTALVFALVLWRRRRRRPT